MGLEKTPEDLFYEGLVGTKLRKEASVPDPVPPIVYDNVEEEEDELEKLGQDPREPPPTEDEQAVDKTSQLLFRQVTKSNLFSHPEAHPYVLDLALIKTFGLEWFTWEQETLFEEIKQTFNTSIADINRVKIMATMTLHVVDSAWEQWEVFENTIHALNGDIAHPGYVQPCDVPFLMAGVDIINDIRKEDFSDEVGRYVAACFLHDEISYAPPPLDFAQPFLSQPRYACQHCGNHGDALPPFDGRCDSCAAKFEDEHPFNFKAAEWAKDDPEEVSYFLKYDFRDTQKRFEEWLDKPASEIVVNEVAEDIEAAKLLTAVDYMGLRRKQKNQQLTDLKDWLVP